MLDRGQTSSRVLNKAFKKLEKEGFNPNDIKDVFNSVFNSVKYYSKSKDFPTINIKGFGTFNPSPTLLRRRLRSKPETETVIDRLKKEKAKRKRK